jgi:orotate phosphoribosyltransferase
MHQLATWWDVLDVSRNTGQFDSGVLNEIELFLKDPGRWSAAHGGISAIGERRRA